jgi:hypothetical protein
MTATRRSSPHRPGPTPPSTDSEKPPTSGSETQRKPLPWLDSIVALDNFGCRITIALRSSGVSTVMLTARTGIVE